MGTVRAFSWGLSVLSAVAWGQTLSRIQGLHTARPTQVALVGVHIWEAPGKVTRNGVLVLQGGRILRIEAAATFQAPPGVQVLRYPAGTWVYPAFVEAWNSWGLPSLPPKSNRTPQYETIRPPLFYPNDAVRLDFAAESSFVYNPQEAARLRKMGFAVAHIAPKEGILRGSGTTVLLLDEGPAPQRYLPGPVLWHAGFEKGHASQEYPSSKMGAIALIRQVLYDALWYRQQTDGVKNLTLDRLLQASGRPARWCWTAQAPEDAFRVARLMREWSQLFPVEWALLATGYEYEWLPYLPKEGLYIVPVGLPAPPPAHSPDFYAQLPLRALRRWECAPFRFKWLKEAGHKVALTSYGLSEPETFWEHLRTIARTGINSDSILWALTQAPAEWLGLPNIGRIAPGAWANLIVFSDTLWKPQARLLETWVAGQREVLIPIPPISVAGTFALSTPAWQLQLPSELPPTKARILAGTDTLSAEVKYNPTTMLFTFLVPAQLGGGLLTFSAAKDTLLEGTWVQLSGQRIPFTARRIAPPESPTPKSLPPLSEDSLISRRTYPNSAYGRPTFPPVEALLIRNATVWTGDTVLPATDVLIAQGKIQRIGQNLLPPPGTPILEANGNALTAGIIDEHSHIAIEGGVNEATDAITAEVRIRDVIDPTDINIYRHLAGGVVAVQLLHGSANPIGGQSACIKLKWGLPDDSLLIPDAPPFNKFALGENVKQSNWGEAYTIRYPQTRMGVEQIIADAFEAAKRYQDRWAAYETARKKNPRLPAPRRDLRLEAIAEILSRKRFITCHSYVQSEILMLMRLAERYGFRVRTFTHVLEGYKVAPEMKAHGVFASTFSDWWAYKYEVIEAIPHNAAILLRHGVPTCINSDDAEMGRRLNQEAAKILRYGGAELGIDSITAWKTVTVYPAQALGISHRTGYIREGYDADVVLWDRPTPLSVYSRVQMTFVEGRRLYDRAEAQRQEAAFQAEKAQLVQKAWKAAQENPKGPPLLLRRAVLWHCDTLTDDQHP